MKILGAVLDLPAKQHCQSNPFTSKLGQIGQIGSAVQLVAPKGLAGFWFFNCHGCRIFILCEIHCYFCPHIFCVYYFSLSQCCFDCWVGSYQDKWWHLCADWLMPQTKDIWIVSKYRCNLRLLKKAKILDSWHQNMSKKIGHWARLEWKKCPVFTTYKGCINPVCHSNSVFTGTPLLRRFLLGRISN